MTSVTAKELKEHPADVLGGCSMGTSGWRSLGRQGSGRGGSYRDARLLERLEDLIDAEDALKLQEAEREGTIGLDELREKLGVRGRTSWPMNPDRPRRRTGDQQASSPSKNRP